MAAPAAPAAGAGALLGLSLLIFTGLDKQFEAVLVAVSPEWLTRLTTTF